MTAVTKFELDFDSVGKFRMGGLGNLIKKIWKWYYKSGFSWW